MNIAERILIIMPVGDHDDPHYWTVEGDAIAAHGRFSELVERLARSEPDSTPAIVLVPAEHATYRRVEPQGLEPQQEIAVARITAQGQAIGSVLAAAAFDANGSLMVATADEAVLQAAYLRLSNAGLMISAIVPIGAVIRPVAADVCRTVIGDYATLHAADMCCADEPGMAEIFFSDVQISDIAPAETMAAAIAITKFPVPNFLDGMAIRKARTPLLSEWQRLWAKRLILLAVALFFMGSMVYWAKLQWAISSENNAALEAAQTIDPSITDIAQAEAAVDSALARKAVERAKPAMLVAIVWQSVRPIENLSVSEINLGDDGMLKATLSAPDAESINAALRSLERSGYRITATPRRDQSGVILADLTVRAR